MRTTLRNQLISATTRCLAVATFAAILLGAPSAVNGAQWEVRVFAAEEARWGPGPATTVSLLCYVKAEHAGEPPAGWTNPGGGDLWRRSCGTATLGSTVAVDFAGRDPRYVSATPNYVSPGPYLPSTSDLICSPPIKPCNPSTVVDLPVFAKRGNVRGRVLLLGDIPVAGLEIVAMDMLRDEEMYSTVTGDNGEFDFRVDDLDPVSRARHWAISSEDQRLSCNVTRLPSDPCPSPKVDPTCRCKIVTTTEPSRDYLLVTRRGTRLGEVVAPASDYNYYTYHVSGNEVEPNRNPGRPGAGGGPDGTNQDPRMGTCGGDGSACLSNASRGRPVRLRDGEVWFTHTDTTMFGPRYALNFTRAYHSKDARNGISGLFGPGWSTNVEKRVVELSPKLVRLETGGGGLTYFSDAEGDGSFVPVQPTQDDSSLERTSAKWIRRLRQGGTEEYALSGGRVVKQIDLIGDETVFGWSDDRLQTITLPNNRLLTLEYAHGTRPTGLIGPIGRIASYTYDISDRLEKIVYQDGPAGAQSGYRIQYDADSQVEFVYDLFDRVVEKHTYDAAGRGLTSEAHGGVERLRFDYEENGNVLVTDAVGGSIRYFFAGGVLMKTVACPDCPGGGVTELYGYDGQGRLEKITDAEEKETTFAYDSENRLEKVTDPLNRETKLTYDSYLRIESQTIPGLPNVNGATVTYGPQGPSLVTDGEGRETSFGYTDGLLTSVTDARSKSTTVHRNAIGDVDWVEDADGRRTDFLYNGMGWRTHVTTELGQTFETEYDVRGRVTKSIRPDGTFSEILYDHPRNAVIVTGPDQKRSEQKYDDAGRLVAVRDPANGVTSYSYDDMSRLKWLRDDAGRTTYFFYDDYGRLQQVKYPSDKSESYTYYPTGRLHTVTDRKDVITTYSYDDVGRVTGKQYSDGTSHLTVTYDDAARTVEYVQGGKTVRQKFDKSGLLLEEHQPHGRVDYVYDEAGRRQLLKLDGTAFLGYRYWDSGALRYIDMGAQSFEYTYDEAGRRDLLKYPNGIVTNYDPDNLSRLQQHTVGAGGNPLQQWGLGFDGSDNITSRTATGVHSSTRSYRYDVVDRLVEERVTFAPAVGSAWAYDSVGNRLSAQSGNHISSAAVNDSNQLLSTTAGGSMLVSGRTEPASTVDVWLDSPEKPPTGTVRATQYANGEFLATLDAVTPGPHSLSVEATAAPDRVRRESFEIQVAGDTATLTYDDNGNLETKTTPAGVWRYVWNAANQLVRMCKDVATCTSEEATASFAYDPVGRRISKTAAGSTHTYLYDQSDIVTEVVTGSSPATFQYVHGTGVDEPLARIDNMATTLYYHADHLGSVAFLTDAAGTVPHTYAYDPWGNITAETGPALGGVEYAFTGREWDRETGLYYYRARYYDPKAGRFISEDPIGLAGGINMYSYVEGRPTVARDPSGLKTLEESLQNAVGLILVGTGSQKSPFATGEEKYGPWVDQAIASVTGEQEAALSCAAVLGPRRKPTLPTGNMKEGWIHVDARHIAGDAPGGPGDLFPNTLTRDRAERLGQLVATSGQRVSDPARAIQTFERRISQWGVRDRVRVIVNTVTDTIVTMFPVRK